jgi:hypothetical protein
VLAPGDDEELEAVAVYVGANAVRHGLCAVPEDWPWRGGRILRAGAVGSRGRSQPLRSTTDAVLPLSDPRHRRADRALRGDRAPRADPERALPAARRDGAGEDPALPQADDEGLGGGAGAPETRSSPPPE